MVDSLVLEMPVPVVVVVVVFEVFEALGFQTVVLVWSRLHCLRALILIMVLRGIREVSFL